jgi:hypothetical protein
MREQIVMDGIVVEILKDVRMMDEGWEAGIKWIVWETHDFFRKVSPHVLVHAAVYRESIMRVFTGHVGVKPSTSHMIGLLIASHSELIRMLS